METTEQKINLQLNIDGYKFFETNQSFDDDQTYSNLIQGFMDDLDYKLENMNDSEFGKWGTITIYKIQINRRPNT